MKTHLFILLIQIINLNCASHTVKNCEKYDLENHSCTKCNDKYFPLFHNLFCLPCDDKEYGQVGCGGNCDSSSFENDRFVYCEENKCKEGFIGYLGLCFNCSLESPGCKKCSVEAKNIEGQMDYNFSCQECISDAYKINENGICQKCQMDHCLECRFSNSTQECLKCENNYYLSSDKTCKNCHYKYDFINNRYCRVCSDNETDLDLEKCYCDGYHILNESNNCVYCGEGCLGCILGKDNIPYCLQCYSGYALNEKKCSRCPDGCNSCYFDNNQMKCSSCYSNYALLNGNCEYCEDGCNRCIIDENNNTACIECNYNYVLNPNSSCTYCRNINYLGNGCQIWKYNEIKDKYECLQCRYYNIYQNEYYSYYAYINNKYQCLSNTDNRHFYLYECLEANLIENNIYECFKCNKDFIPIINDKTCRKPSEINLSNKCLEGINLGNISNPIYSCNKCNNETTLITELYNISNCFERSNMLTYCLKGKIDIYGNITCEQYVPSAHLNESNQICECDHDSFGINNLFCYKCDDPIKGNPGCESEEGCEYRIANNQLNCNKCKNNFFEFTKGQCFSCSNEIEFCNKCHLEENTILNVLIE